MRFTILETDGQKFSHLSRTFDNPRSLCGKNPFPERWEVPMPSTKPLCPNCRKRAGV